MQRRRRVRAPLLARRCLAIEEQRMSHTQVPDPGLPRPPPVPPGPMPDLPDYPAPERDDPEQPDPNKKPPPLMMRVDQRLQRVRSEHSFRETGAPRNHLVKCRTGGRLVHPVRLVTTSEMAEEIV